MSRQKVWFHLQKIPRSLVLSSQCKESSETQCPGHVETVELYSYSGLFFCYKNIYSLKKYTNVKFYIFYYIFTYFQSMQ